MTNVFMNSVSVVFDVQVPSAQVELLFPPDMGWFSVTESERDRVLMGHFAVERGESVMQGLVALR